MTRLLYQKKNQRKKRRKSSVGIFELTPRDIATVVFYVSIFFVLISVGALITEKVITYRSKKRHEKLDKEE